MASNNQKKQAGYAARLRGSVQEALGKTPPQPSHAGLVLQRWLSPRMEDEQQKTAGEKRREKGAAERREEEKPEAALVDYAALWAPTNAYGLAFGRWRSQLESIGALLLNAKTRSLLAVGLGNVSPIENGLAIHHTYGAPYLPGSALKGLARRAAQANGLDKEAIEVIFGSVNSAGHVSFLDGWFDPTQSDSRHPYKRDVLTTHHPKYYGGGGEVWPSDFDDPTPVPFLAVKPETSFLVAIHSDSEGAEPWLELARNLLKWGLENLGLGAKTNAGYGYFSCAIPPSPQDMARAEELLREYEGQIKGIVNSGTRSKASKIVRELRQRQEPPGARRAVLSRLKEHLVEQGLWDENNRDILMVKNALEE